MGNANPRQLGGRRAVNLDDLEAACNALAEVRPFFDSRLGRDIALAIVSGDKPDGWGDQSSENAEPSSLQDPKGSRSGTE